MKHHIPTWNDLIIYIVMLIISIVIITASLGWFIAILSVNA